MDYSIDYCQTHAVSPAKRKTEPERLLSTGQNVLRFWMRTEKYGLFCQYLQRSGFFCRITGVYGGDSEKSLNEEAILDFQYNNLV